MSTVISRVRKPKTSPSATATQSRKKSVAIQACGMASISEKRSARATSSSVRRGTTPLSL